LYQDVTTFYSTSTNLSFGCGITILILSIFEIISGELRTGRIYLENIESPGIKIKVFSELLDFGFK
jgi:hypothetical protein